MFRTSTALCPFCEASALFKRPSTRWHTIRDASTLQARRPSRMILSAKVNRPSPPPESSPSRPARKTRNSPFGGMNQVRTPRELEGQFGNNVSAAELKRQTRMRPAKSEKQEKERDPMKALKMQRALATVSYGSRGRVKEQIAQIDDFNDFALLPVVNSAIATQALEGLADITPTPVQRLAIPALLQTQTGRRKRRNELSVEQARKQLQTYLLAAETGSGKTLAYVLPVIDALKRAEAIEEAESGRIAAEEEGESTKDKLYTVPAPDIDGPDPSAGRPKAIILVPTAELVSQVGGLLKSLSHTVKFRTAIISAAFSGTVIRNRLFSSAGVDVVVSTPHLLGSITESDPNILSRVTHLVIDEADSLLDRSFSPITNSIIERATPSLSQLIFCSATIPRSLDSYLNKRYPDTHRLATPHLHALPRRVQLSVVDIEKIPYQGNRDLACAQTIWDIGKDDQSTSIEWPDSFPSASNNAQSTSTSKKIVVFVNEREKASELTNYLRTRGIDATALSRDVAERTQAATLASFTGRGSNDSPSDVFAGSDLGRRRLANTQVLVTTDIASRGIDTLPVRHVVLYDVPHTSIDFIHRLGRVGRMGRRGRGVVLVGKHDRKDVVKEVRDGMFRGQALI